MRVWIGAALVLGMLSSIALGLWPREAVDGVEQAAALDVAPAPEMAIEVSPASTPRPASLRESEVDGDLTLDSGGHFAPTPAALALFDYFLSASGEEPPERIRGRIESEIAHRLPREAAPEAVAFLDRYLAYRAAAARVAGDERLAASADLERRLQWLRELRREHFGADLATTLFGDDERAVEAALARRRVIGDASLSDDEKRERLEALEQALPASARGAREAATLPLRLAEQERALRAAGASESELRALREREVGAEAADRLAALDRRRAEWEARIDSYRRERDALLASTALARESREAELDVLRTRHFDAREQLRVRALDAIELEAAAGR